MAKKRIEFESKIKDIIAKRAGFKCSFPDCNKTLIGPGVNNNESVCIGECAHIFSAVQMGPRTDGGLSEEELKRPENGIFLCRNHHKIVDAKSKSNKYTSDLLVRYKTRHEFLISAELGEYCYPLNWINSIEILGGIFRMPLKINLGKVTLLTGGNGTGKSTIIEILSSIFSQKIEKRWNEPEIEFSAFISLDNPVLSKFKSIIKNNQLYYEIKNETQPFVPYDFFVLCLRDVKARSKTDDLKEIAECLGLERSFVKSMLLTTGVKHGLRTKEVRIREVRTKPYLDDRLEILFDDHDEFHPFSGYSSTEQSSIILDITISFALEMSRFKSVLLLIDWRDLYSFSDTTIKPYLDYLQRNDAHFQTVLVSHNERISLDWSGWVNAKLVDDSGQIKVIQNEK